ncbi:hypothetical protein BDZ88DRAFT_157706 [Geranomyces variabilis]|nr:hypothetical protein BDZ88DRAFT_157706 [Geranomyces variabilis]
MYTELLCSDFSDWTGVQITITAPAGSIFSVAFQSAPDGICTRRDNTFSHRTDKFIKFDGTVQTFRIPFDFFTTLDSSRIYALVFQAFNNPGTNYTLRSVVFDEGPGVTPFCPTIVNGPVNETFTTQGIWEDASQKGGGPHNYGFVSYMLRFTVDPTSVMRPKLRFPTLMNGPGRHRWRVYVPMYEKGDITSI